MVLVLAGASTGLGLATAAELVDDGMTSSCAPAPSAPSRGRISPTEHWASRARGTGGGERNRWLSTSDIFWAASEWRADWGHWATSGTGAE